MNSNPESRRTFLLKGIFKQRALLSKLISASEKTKMLTEDGKLVEVDTSVIKNCKKVTQAENKDICDWINEE